MTQKKRAQARRKPGRRPVRPPSRQQLLEADPWHFRRLEDPVFIALCNLLVRRPRVVYEIRDWEPWMFKTRPGGRLTRDPDPICGSQSHLYNEVAPRSHKFGARRGGGYIERFASSVEATLYDRRSGWWGGAVALRPRYEEAAWLIELSERQGFTRWRTLRNGVEVWACLSPKVRVRHYRAFKDGREVGSWGRYEGPGNLQPTGQIGGDYSLVQGTGAPCAEFRAWLREVGKREITPTPRLSEAIVATLRHDYEREVETYDAEAQEQRFQETGRRSHLKPRKVRRSFEQMLRAAGWTKAILAEADRELERQRRLITREQEQATKAAAAARQAKPTTTTRRTHVRKPTRTRRDKHRGGNARSRR